MSHSGLLCGFFSLLFFSGIEMSKVRWKSINSFSFCRAVGTLVKGAIIMCGNLKLLFICWTRKIPAQSSTTEAYWGYDRMIEWWCNVIWIILTASLALISSGGVCLPWSYSEHNYTREISSDHTQCSCLVIIIKPLW